LEPRSSQHIPELTNAIFSIGIEEELAFRITGRKRRGQVWTHRGGIARDWLLPIGIGFAIFLAVEAEKASLRKLKS
jgi:hypothetical protein